MRIAFYTRNGFDSSELFLYIFGMVASQFNDVHIVAVYPDQVKTASILRRYLKKMRRVGLFGSLEIISSYPLSYVMNRRDNRLLQEMLRSLPRPRKDVKEFGVIKVTATNGPDAVRAITDIKPDILIQAGAGILKTEVFTIPRLGTLNLHHGIAPAISGMNSIYWALWENKPEWIGSTVHKIDEGIDSGPVLAYAPVELRFPGEGFVPLFVRATQKGVESMVDTLRRLECGETWSVPASGGMPVYRSTFSGWKRCILGLRLAISRYTSRPAGESSLFKHR